MLPHACGGGGRDRTAVQQVRSLPPHPLGYSPTVHTARAGHRTQVGGLEGPRAATAPHALRLQLLVAGESGLEPLSDSSGGCRLIHARLLSHVTLDAGV